MVRKRIVTDDSKAHGEESVANITLPSSTPHPKPALLGVNNEIPTSIPHYVYVGPPSPTCPSMMPNAAYMPTGIINHPNTVPIATTNQVNFNVCWNVLCLCNVIC